MKGQLIMTKKLMKIMAIAAMASLGQLTEARAIFGAVADEEGVKKVCKGCYEKCMTPAYLATFAAKADENDLEVKVAKVCGAGCIADGCYKLSEKDNSEALLAAFREAKAKSDAEKSASLGNEMIVNRVQAGDAVSEQMIQEDRETMDRLKQLEAEWAVK